MGPSEARVDMNKMKYECCYNSETNIIEVVTHGQASVTEILDMLRCIDELCTQNVSADIMVNHSELEAGSITMDEISIISRHAASVKDLLKTRKCAHVVAKDIQFGLVRAWEIMVEVSGVTDFHTRIFRNTTDALAWIRTGSEPGT